MSVQVAEVNIDIKTTDAKLSLRVEGVYKNGHGRCVTIWACSLQNEAPYYYQGDDGRFYAMDGSSPISEACSLVETVSLDQVPAPEMKLGRIYRTERNDRVWISRESDVIEGYPFVSTVGDFYNDKGERYRATPGSNLVQLLAVS